MLKTAVAASIPITTVERSSAARLLIGQSPRTEVDNGVTGPLDPEGLCHPRSTLQRNEWRTRAPTLVYDGDCGICRYWVDYWRGLTGERVVYRPYQEAAADFPAIAPAKRFGTPFSSSSPTGRRIQARAATFRVLREAPGRGAWWWLYAHRAGLRRGERMGVCILCAPSRRAQSRSRSSCGDRRSRRSAMTSFAGCSCAFRCDLRRGVRLTRRADPRARGQQRNPAAHRLPRRSAPRARRRGVPNPAYAFLDQCERHRARRGNRSRRACWD